MEKKSNRMKWVIQKIIKLIVFQFHFYFQSNNNI